MKDVDTDKARKILKKVAEIIVKTFDERVGIDHEEDDQSDEEGDDEGDAEKVEVEEAEEDYKEDEEWITLQIDNQFRFIEEIKLSIDEEDDEISHIYKEIQKAIKKQN